MTRNDPLFITFMAAQEMCRAVKEKRRKELIAEGIDPYDAERLVWTSVPRRDFVPDAEGWVHIANMYDDLDGVYWYIKFNVTTQKLRLYGPRK